MKRAAFARPLSTASKPRLRQGVRFWSRGPNIATVLYTSKVPQNDNTVPAANRVRVYSCFVWNMGCIGLIMIMLGIAMGTLHGLLLGCPGYL